MSGSGSEYDENFVLKDANKGSRLSNPYVIKICQPESQPGSAKKMDHIVEEEDDVVEDVH